MQYGEHAPIALVLPNVSDLRRPKVVIDPPCAPSIGSCYRSAHRAGMRSLAAVLTRAAAAAVATDPFARFQGQPAYTMLHGFVNDGLVRWLSAQQHTADDACILFIYELPSSGRGCYSQAR